MGELTIFEDCIRAINKREIRFDSGGAVFNRKYAVEYVSKDGLRYGMYVINSVCTAYFGLDVFRVTYIKPGLVIWCSIPFATVAAVTKMFKLSKILAYWMGAEYMWAAFAEDQDSALNVARKHMTLFEKRKNANSSNIVEFFGCNISKPDNDSLLDALKSFRHPKFVNQLRDDYNDIQLPYCCKYSLCNMGESVKLSEIWYPYILIDESKLDAKRKLNPKNIVARIPPGYLIYKNTSYRY